MIFAVWGLSMVVLLLVILATMLRARIFDLASTIKDKDNYIQAMSWTVEDETDVRVFDTNEDHSGLIDDWMLAHEVVDPVARRNTP